MIFKIMSFIQAVFIFAEANTQYSKIEGQFFFWPIYVVSVLDVVIAGIQILIGGCCCCLCCCPDAEELRENNDTELTRYYAFA